MIHARDQEGTRTGWAVSALDIAEVIGDPMRRAVEEKLGLQRSPQQISGWLRTAFVDQVEIRVRHETIYLSSLVQSCGALRRELAHELRRGHRGLRPTSGVAVWNWAKDPHAVARCHGRQRLVIERR